MGNDSWNDYGLPRGDDITEDGELVQVSHLVPKSLKEAAQANAKHGELSEVVRDAYRVVAYGGSYAETGRLEQEIRKVQSDRERVAEKLDELQSELELLEQREAELQEHLDQAETVDEQVESLLAEMEEMIYAGEPVFPDHGKVQTTAGLAGTSEEEIIERLQTRNPELPAAAFTARIDSEEAWTGTENSSPFSVTDE